MNYKKGISSIAVLIAIVFVLGVGFAVYRNNANTPTSTNSVLTQNQSGENGEAQTNSSSSNQNNQTTTGTTSNTQTNTNTKSGQISVTTLAATDARGFGCESGPGTCPEDGPVRITLHGTYSGGVPTAFWFEYWNKNDSAKKYKLTPMAGVPYGSSEIGYGSSGIIDEIAKEGLLAGQKYYYRLVVSNSSGVYYGNTVMFSIPVS